jgi:SAM-dependent methyltransferase
MSTAADTPVGVVATLFSMLPDGRILNVGSGRTGGNGAGPAQHVVGCDHVDVLGATGSTPFAVGDAQRLPYADASFDGVLAKDVLEHLDDVLGALGELRRVTRAGGTLVLTVPRAIPRAVWADVTHRRGFTGDALDRALGLTGWRLHRRGRSGAVPGAGRLGIERHLPQLLRIPGFGHWFGTNWLVVATRD